MAELGANGLGGATVAENGAIRVWAIGRKRSRFAFGGDFGLSGSPLQAATCHERQRVNFERSVELPMRPSLRARRLLRDFLSA